MDGTETVAGHSLAGMRAIYVTDILGNDGYGTMGRFMCISDLGVETGSGIIRQDIETVRIRDGCQCIVVSGPDLVIFVYVVFLI